MGRAKSRAEIQADYRRRRDADPVRRNTYLQQECNKYKKDILHGKRKLVGDMTEREKRRSRLQWKKRQRRSRLARSSELTPPMSRRRRRRRRRGFTSAGQCLYARIIYSKLNLMILILISNF